MKITVTAKVRNQTKKVAVKGNSNVLNVLKELKINPETVLVKRGKEIITDEEILGNGDEIEIIKVVSGG